ncbi:MAG: hypothetical protein ACJ74G_22270 [Blastocatellia bacterium]
MEAPLRHAVLLLVIALALLGEALPLLPVLTILVKAGLLLALLFLRPLTLLPRNVRLALLIALPGALIGSRLLVTLPGALLLLLLLHLLLLLRLVLSMALLLIGLALLLRLLFLNGLLLLALLPFSRTLLLLLLILRLILSAALLLIGLALLLRRLLLLLSLVALLLALLLGRILRGGKGAGSQQQCRAKHRRHHKSLH